MKTFIVVYVCLINCETHLEKIEALNWIEAVQKHSKYPWQERSEQEFKSVDELFRVNEIPFVNDEDQIEEFKHFCYSCDTLMDWIKVS